MKSRFKLIEPPLNSACAFILPGPFQHLDSGPPCASTVAARRPISERYGGRRVATHNTSSIAKVLPLFHMVKRTSLR